MNIRHPGQLEKIEIHMGAVLKLPAKQHCQFGPFTKKSGKMGAKPSFYIKFIAI
jgi:hypothetical protein